MRIDWQLDSALHKEPMTFPAHERCASTTSEVNAVPLSRKKKWNHASPNPLSIKRRVRPHFFLGSSAGLT